MLSIHKKSQERSAGQCVSGTQETKRFVIPNAVASSPRRPGKSYHGVIHDEMTDDEMMHDSW